MNDSVVLRRDTDPTGDQFGVMSQTQLDKLFPERPRNAKPTIPFNSLISQLFDPLNNARKTTRVRVVARAKAGPHGPAHRSPREQKHNVIEKFIAMWRQEVGDDIYPAFRLIMPDKDRDRPLYGLKEKAIGKLLVRAMRIHKDSDDGSLLMNWKTPGPGIASRLAGDFPGRCFDVLAKRQMIHNYGSLSVAEVNELLDELALASKEEKQLQIMQRFYEAMNAEELMWLIRMILRQMKVGATEKTIFALWHPDANAVFNMSSSLRRVCWELWNPESRLQKEDIDVNVMSCYRPQLAQFQAHTFDKMIERMRLKDDLPIFWIEEKLDGERLQLHMQPDPELPGGKRFGFWSRRAKDYTYLYGEGLCSSRAALTIHLQDAFHEGVESIILDGEMITWDPEEDAIVAFGTLKTAALSEQANPFTASHRPLLKVFDILYLNGQSLTGYPLRERRQALEAAVRPVARRLEIHEYRIAQNADEIESRLREVVAEASEGLVLKNPESAYKLNERNDDWVKVKPEYMTESGESLDCLIVGGYYGTGRRGGFLSSFLCGLRAGHLDRGSELSQCFQSFAKVGGGFAAYDYQQIRHHTAGKWTVWDAAHPPSQYVELAGGALQIERPDEWIRPEDSIVISIKAAQVVAASTFRCGYTLRFPRLQKIRSDRNWRTALSIQSFLDAKENQENDRREKQFTVDETRSHRAKRFRETKLLVLGQEENSRSIDDAHKERWFESMTFYVMTGSPKPQRKSKVELEMLIKAHGGRILQSYGPDISLICLGAKDTVSVLALKKRGGINIVKPGWVIDCIDQMRAHVSVPTFIIPLEPRHYHWLAREAERSVNHALDICGDSYARDLSHDELKAVTDSMPTERAVPNTFGAVSRRILKSLVDLPLPFRIFYGLLIFVPLELGAVPESFLPDSKHRFICYRARVVNLLVAGGARMASSLQETGVTHVIAQPDTICSPRYWAAQISVMNTPFPRLMSSEWVFDSWKHRTRIAEERFNIR